MADPVPPTASVEREHLPWDFLPYRDISAQLAETTVTWRDLAWIKQAWGDGPVLVYPAKGYGDYLEQLTYLIFLKMADERGLDLSRTRSAGVEHAVDCSWPALAAKASTLLSPASSRKMVLMPHMNDDASVVSSVSAR